MALDVPVAKRQPDSADDMVALGHMAVNANRPQTKRLTKKSPIPREARVAFGVGLGVLVSMLVLAFLRAHI
jgi:hypothetical protein